MINVIYVILIVLATHKKTMQNVSAIVQAALLEIVPVKLVRILTNVTKDTHPTISVLFAT